MVVYNVANWGTVAAGATILVGYTWGNGGFGAQWAQAAPENSDADLVVTNHSMNKDDGGTMNYGFQLSNFGRNSTSYDLDGGSVGS